MVRHVMPLPWFSPGTISFELLKGMPTALVALLAACLARWIAYQQYQVARARLNFDLFDKRYAIFEEVWRCMSDVVTTGPVPAYLSSPFDRFVPQATFLFGPEIEVYLRQASENLQEIWAISLRTKANHDVMPLADINRHRELLQWFLDEAQHGARRIFTPFLDFSRWKQFK